MKWLSFVMAQVSLIALFYGLYYHIDMWINVWNGSMFIANSVMYIVQSVNHE